MENRDRLVILYDYYGELLTDLQKEYFEDYYFSNLSLSEIAENNNVSRNAVHNQIKVCEEKLENYEEKLKAMAFWQGFLLNLTPTLKFWFHTCNRN